jgi:hypothetical protein
MWAEAGEEADPSLPFAEDAAGFGMTAVGSGWFDGGVETGWGTGGSG